MSHVTHHAIVVTSWNEEELKEAHQKAQTIGLMVSAIVLHGYSDVLPAYGTLNQRRINGGGSFFVAPDGSNDGWPESDQGDVRRWHFLKYLREVENIIWVEIAYSPDDATAEVTQHTWDTANSQKAEDNQPED